MTRSPWLPRLLLGAGAVGVFAAVVALSIGEGGPEKVTISGGEQTQQLIAGIPQDGPYLGPSDASVTITVFNDLQCSSCDDYQLHTVDPLIEQYARTGQARVEFRHISFQEAETTEAAYAAAAAGEQDREWQYIDLLFRNQDQAPARMVSDEFLTEIGNAIPNFDLDAWTTARDAAEVSDRVEADAQLAAELGLRGSGPSVVVTGPGDPKVLQDSPSKQEIDAAVSAVGG
ncbi:MAG: thioredoxin domain-containing protein [Actinomycetota bacterium]